MAKESLSYMDLAPQPPPDAPAPPPGPEAIRSHRVMRRILVAGTLSIIGILIAGMILIAVRRPHRGSSLTEATSNMKSLHLAILEFDSDYGSFPDASTMAEIKATTSTTLPLGTTSSNEIFRQLMATTVRSESAFWARTAITPRKPDNNISGGHALEKGECAFAYIAGLSASDDPATPIMMAPVDPAGRCFERTKDYGNKSVILFIDGSVKHLPVDKHGQVQLNGMDLFDPRQPFWKGKTPDIKWPE